MEIVVCVLFACLVWLSILTVWLVRAKEKESAKGQALSDELHQIHRRIDSLWKKFNTKQDIAEGSVFVTGSQIPGVASSSLSRIATAANAAAETFRVLQRGLDILLVELRENERRRRQRAKREAIWFSFLLIAGFVALWWLR